MLYAASTLALAALEYLVHVDPEDVPSDLLAVELSLPTDSAEEVESRAVLPPDWRAATAPDECRQIGADWIASGTSLCLTVPSVIIPHERNVLVSPRHGDMGAVRVLGSLPFSFDPRLRYRV